MNTTSQRSLIALFLAAALMTGCASVELSTHGSGTDAGNDVLQQMARDSEGA